MSQILDSVLFDEDEPERAAEYLRLTLNLLSRQNISANPVNYDLLYTYVAGKNTQLNEKLDEFLEGEKDWDHQEAKQLFKRFFYRHSESCLEDIREELLRIVTHSLGTLVDAAGKTSSSNESLQQHVKQLASAGEPEHILSSVALILNEARAFVTESMKLEEELVTSSREVNKLKAELVNARNEAMTDALTGLYNRRGFNLALAEITSSCNASNGCYSLLLADLDHFKRINDMHGHLIGDKVLTVFARTLKKHSRKKDYLARFGGEEFVLILPDTSLDNARQIAEDIRRDVSGMRLKNSSTKEIICDLSVSFGVVQHRHDETDKAVTSRCDQALYRAKHKGRNCVVAD